MNVYEIIVKETGERGYFSSIKALTDAFPKAVIGCSTQCLYNARLRAKGSFNNKRCTIRRCYLNHAKREKLSMDDSVIFNVREPRYEA